MIASSAAADALVAAVAGSGPAIGSVLPLQQSAASAGAASSALQSAVSTFFAPLSTAGALLSGGWQWAKRNKAKVAGGTLVTGAVAGYLVYRKVAPMLAQLRSEFAMIEQMTKQLSPQDQPAQKHAVLIHRLEHNLSVGDVTLRQFAQQVRKDLVSRFDVDGIRGRLKKSGPGSRSESDLELWGEFKVAGFSRTLSALYTISLLHALIKVQLSVVSRYVLFDQQAQQQRQEQEAAAREGQQPPTQQQNAMQPTAQSSPAGASGGPGVGNFPAPPAFMPSAVCEEVNRLYFSLSRHGQSVGAAQLADHVEALVRHELAPWRELTALVAEADLQSALRRIQERVESEALGLESKTEVEARGSNEEAELADAASASAAGVSAASTVFTSTQAYVRFLLPNSAGLSSLVSSTSFPDPAINNMASFRLAEMVAETNAIVNSSAFQCALAASFNASFDELFRLLSPSFAATAAAPGGNGLQSPDPSAASASASAPAPAPAATKSIPFVHALVAVIKQFNAFLPDVPAGASAAAAQSVASPLFHALSDLPAVKELCAVIYLPHDVVTAAGHSNAQSTLQHITSNRQFAGPKQTQQQQLTARQPARVELIDESTEQKTAATPAPTSAAAQLLQDIRGVPVFDRL